MEEEEEQEEEGEASCKNNNKKKEKLADSDHYRKKRSVMASTGATPLPPTISILEGRRKDQQRHQFWISFC